MTVDRRRYVVVVIGGVGVAVPRTLAHLLDEIETAHSGDDGSEIGAAEGSFHGAIATRARKVPKLDQLSRIGESFAA